MADDRIDELEIKLAFQDKLISELDAFVKALAERLDETRRDLDQLKKAIVSPEPTVGPANEPPPHY
ncbi:MAG: SlyX family protein [Kofleriaceae bacterium]